MLISEKAARADNAIHAAIADIEMEGIQAGDVGSIMRLQRLFRLIEARIERADCLMNRRADVLIHAD